MKTVIYETPNIVVIKETFDSGKEQFYIEFKQIFAIKEKTENGEVMEASGVIEVAKELQWIMDTYGY